MSIASIFAVASSIFIVAIFYIIGANIEYFMGQLESQMGMAVRIERGISAADQARLEQRLMTLNHVASVTFVSREEALESMADRIGEYARSNKDFAAGLTQKGYKCRRDKRGIRWQGIAIRIENTGFYR